MKPAQSTMRLLQSATGKGIRVAVIDSGINPQHSHVRRVSGGIHLFWDSGNVSSDENWLDTLGHGTAVAGILRERAPDVELFSVRVFDRTLRTHAEVVDAAIRWAADHKMHVANCSFSTDNLQHHDLLQDACDYAEDHGTVIVASGDENTPGLFPAAFKNVVAVAADDECDWDRYRYSSAARLFFAHSHPKPLPRLPQKFNLKGHSFAAAHVTALVARICEMQPLAKSRNIAESLMHFVTQTQLRSSLAEAAL